MSDTPVIRTVIGRKKTFGDTAERNEGAMMEKELAQLRAELAQLADDSKRLTDSILALRGEMVLVRKMWKETIDENKQLRAELEMNKANLESFMQLQGEHKKLCDLVAERYKIYLKDQAEMVRLRAALDEARKVILHIFQEHDGCNFAEDWLMAHPEEPK